jgi:hypothetical protein
MRKKPRAHVAQKCVAVWGNDKLNPGCKVSRAAGMDMDRRKRRTALS